MNDLTGFWQFACFEATTQNTTNQLNDHFTFWYGVDEVIVRLVPIGVATWQAADGFYRLTARWNENMLQYLNPIQQWHFIASLHNGHFEQLDHNRKKIFTKVKEAEIVNWNKAITDLSRPLFDYSLVL